EMRFKQALACYRPIEYNAEVQPMITTPGHGSFPMGHATQAHAVAYVLKQLLKLDKTAHPPHKWVIDQFDRQAARIATNRVIAGLHFPVDSMAGRMLGVALGEYFYGRCTGHQTFMSRTFNSAVIDGQPTLDFNPFSADQKLDEAPTAGKLYSYSAGTSVTRSDLMEHLWDKAQHEWKGRFGVH
ncbi:MAG TPA: phosphatase PAP2 family protein, partial [Bradyrhizobium sp.]|nr:phosphatase PAP2 family protein [Bradyrhizobium sp.]